MEVGGSKKLWSVESERTIFVLSVGYGEWLLLHEGQEYDPDRENSTPKSSLKLLLEKWSWKTAFFISGDFWEKEQVWQEVLPRDAAGSALLPDVPLDELGGGGGPELGLLVEGGGLAATCWEPLELLSLVAGVK